MKGKNHIVGAILGALLTFFSVGAYFSNEPAAKTDNGRIVVALAFVFGMFTLINNIFKKDK